MLFTHFGVSGPLILTGSSFVSKQIKKGPLRLVIDLKPALTKEQLDARLLREFEEGKNKLIKEGYKSHDEYLECIPNLKYIVEVLACLGTEEEVYFDYGFADEDMMQMMGIKVFPEGMAMAMGSYYCETEGPECSPARLQDQSDRLANPRVFQKLSKFFK